jgi:hypothetical protein
MPLGLTRAPSHGPSGGVADSLDEAKVAFRADMGGAGVVRFSHETIASFTSSNFPGAS